MIFNIDIDFKEFLFIFRAQVRFIFILEFKFIKKKFLFHRIPYFLQMLCTRTEYRTSVFHVTAHPLCTWLFRYRMSHTVSAYDAYFQLIPSNVYVLDLTHFKIKYLQKDKRVDIISFEKKNCAISISNNCKCKISQPFQYQKFCKCCLVDGGV